MSKIFLYLFISIFFYLNIFAQQNTGFYEPQNIPFQKLYLHIDRDFYANGDTLWFAGYLVDGATHCPLIGNNNLHFELIDTCGNVWNKKLFKISNGFCPGWIELKDTVNHEGNFLVRAYTDYMRNFGEETFFTKNIHISKIKAQGQVQETEFKGKVPEDIHIDFFPEGGFLLANQLNPVAFKAVDHKGNEVEVNGKLIDDKGRVIKTFKSSYKGLGVFHFTPERNVKYTVKLDNSSKLTQNFPTVRTVGAKIINACLYKNYVMLDISSSINSLNEPLHLVGICKGEETFTHVINTEEISKPFLIESSQLMHGINRLVLLNANFEPISERLVFNDLKKDIELGITLNKNNYKTREKVELQVKTNDINNNAEDFINISLVVIDENYLNAKGIKQNIKSYLLADSELKGQIPSPADFFIDEDHISSKEKIDLLLLTHGWKNYIYDKWSGQSISMLYKPQFGTTIKGKTSTKNNRKILPNCNVVLSAYLNNENKMYTSLSDSVGNFEFDNIVIPDSSYFIVTATNAKNRPNVFIELEKPFYPTHKIDSKTLTTLKNNTDIPLSLYRTNYLHYLAKKAYYPDYETKLIEEVQVSAELIEKDDGNSRIYTKPKNSFKVEEKEFFHANIFSYLEAKAAGISRGIDEYGNTAIKLRGYGTAQIIWDGMPISNEEAASKSIMNVETVEVLKGTEASMFGARASRGVVNVISRANGIVESEPKEMVATLVQRINGFAPYRKFYSPKYTRDNIKSEAPDLRTTLYWNPNIIMEGDKADVSFFTCDNIGRYKIFVEGITNSGNICLGSGELEINKKR